MSHAVSLRELYDQRNSSRRDRYAYEHTLNHQEGNWRVLLDELWMGDTALLSDWLRFNADKIDTANGGVMAFLRALAEREGYNKGNRTLVKTALSFPDIDESLSRWFQEICMMSRDFTIIVDVSVRFIEDSLLIEEVAHRTILPMVKQSPWVLPWVIKQARTTRYGPSGSSHLLALTHKYSIPIHGVSVNARQAMNQNVGSSRIASPRRQLSGQYRSPI